MRYPGSEKLEIIRLVEQSHLPVRRTLATLGILPMTFYRWYARLQAFFGLQIGIGLGCYVQKQTFCPTQRGGYVYHF